MRGLGGRLLRPWRPLRNVSALWVASACATGGLDTSRLPQVEMWGHLVTVAQASWFEPCGGEGEPRMWVTFTGASVDQIRRVREDWLGTEDSRAFVRWTASPTDERLVGPGGPALLVRDLREIRPPTPEDCR